ERPIDGGEFDSDRAGPNDHQRFWNFLQAENFDIGENTVARFEPGDHPGFRTAGENYIFRFQVRCLTAVCDFHAEDAVLSSAGELAVSADGLDFVLLHQELETFGMLGNDLAFTLLNGGPVELARVHPFDAEFLRLFEMVPEFSVEQQGLGGNAAH